VLKWTHLGRGFWRVSATCEVRGRGMNPKANDPYWHQVVLLMGFENTESPTTFIDESPAANAVARVGSAGISSFGSLIGEGSLALDGTGASLFIANTPNFGFGSGAWTMELTVVCNTAPAGGSFPLLDFRTDQFEDGAMFIGGSEGAFFYFDGTTSSPASGGATLSAGVTYRLALSYDGEKIRGFIDGAMQFEEVRSVDFGSSNLLRIGVNFYTADSLDQSNATFDEIRVTRGVCRFAGPYTVEAGPFPRY
jgi:hypothetical protein